MIESVLMEIEECIQCSGELSGVPVIWGINPSHSAQMGFPRIGVYVFVPAEREVWPDKVQMAYSVKVNYYFQLDSSWPTGKSELASIHSKALLMRQAFRSIYARQVSGESSLQIDIDGVVEQEISILDSFCEIGTNFTLLIPE